MRNIHEQEVPSANIINLLNERKVIVQEGIRERITVAQPERVSDIIDTNED